MDSIQKIKKNIFNSIKPLVRYRNETFSDLDLKIWNFLPEEHREIDSFSIFKGKISNWETDKCLCWLCKTYMQHLGFICIWASQ